MCPCTHVCCTPHVYNLDEVMTEDRRAERVHKLVQHLHPIMLTRIVNVASFFQDTYVLAEGNALDGLELALCKANNLGLRCAHLLYNSQQI